MFYSILLTAYRDDSAGFDQPGRPAVHHHAIAKIR